MPKVKVPGIDREIEFDLHEPVGAGVPLLAEVGSEVQLDPPGIAAAMEQSDSGWAFSVAPHETIRRVKRAEVTRDQVVEVEAQRRRVKAAQAGPAKNGRGRGGHPAHVFFSLAEDVAVVAAYYMTFGEKRGHAIELACGWLRDAQGYKEPSDRLVDAALARLRAGGVSQVGGIVQHVRAKYRLGELPAPSKGRRIK